MAVVAEEVEAEEAEEPPAVGSLEELVPCQELPSFQARQAGPQEEAQPPLQRQRHSCTGIPPSHQRDKLPCPWP